MNTYRRVAVVTFLIMRLLPGDVAQMLLSEWGASAEQVKTLRWQLGLDDPLHVQFVKFLWRAAQGDLGRSIHTHRAVVQEILSQFSRTLELTVAGLVIGVGLGIGLGVLAAVRENTWVEASRSVEMVICDGRVLVRDGKVPGVDEYALAARMQAAAGRTLATVPQRDWAGRTHEQMSPLSFPVWEGGEHNGNWSMRRLR